MALRQFAILMLLLSAGMLAAGVSRSGLREREVTAPAKPATPTLAALAAPVEASEQPKPEIRVILPSPYEAR